MRTLNIIQTKFPRVPAPASVAPAAPGPEQEPQEIAADLRDHLALCQDVLALVEKENLALRQPDPGDLRPLTALKRNLLPRLGESVARLKRQRLRWQQMSPEVRARRPEIGGLLRQNQDLIMKIIVLDRENEQTLLKRGMVPVQQLPPAQRQQAHYVTELYRRQGAKPL